MQQTNLIKRRRVLSVLLTLLLLSIVSMATSGVMGGDLFDGFAGGTRVNTRIESLLMYGGFIVAVSSFSLTIITLAYILILRFLKSNMKSWTEKILSGMLLCGLVGVLALLFMIMTGWGI